MICTSDILRDKSWSVVQNQISRLSVVFTLCFLCFLSSPFTILTIFALQLYQRSLVGRRNQKIINHQILPVREIYRLPKERLYGVLKDSAAIHHRGAHFSGIIDASRSEPPSLLKHIRFGPSTVVGVVITYTSSAEED
ncbi:hypothetical protein OCU04_010109 [Sclerotinia nivalis]|uniref:Uncharacterized protein n=1 Tax=Sclerotinia nivalis TaxID=352851 RepID=A0A9X0AE20_9HELO|nr:hypothetical protein OCU04_010109 [Sclerotinia nivalis]